MDLSDAFLECLCGTSRHNQVLNVNSYRLITEKPPLEPSPTATLSSAPSQDKNAILASQIIDIIRTASRSSPKTDHPSRDITHDLTPLIEDTTPIRAEDWTSYLTERVLRALEETIKHVAEEQDTWGEALRDAYGYAVEAVQAELTALWEHTKEHPYETVVMVLLTVLALGVLARLVPVFVRVLGFAKEGPLEGSFAACWQSLYKGHVPKGSLWSFLQRMGMTWD
ncbi:uncharacterized protein C8A04DRAFT_28899 [Dichotomopilus funicola]|uniref:Uncharacterized protein n=1 Tax=Dichotomopilus funicola TaxID=1934379 RepID=A0AAN6V281_9PEZI|nr:hypothetical protein C8A04DRAFT_28899 [Dichotomopilus funicola]